MGISRRTVPSRSSVSASRRRRRSARQGDDGSGNGFNVVCDQESRPVPGSGWLRREKQLELLVAAVRGNANAAIVHLDFVLSLKGPPSHGRQQPVGSRWCHRIPERYTPPEWKFAHV